MTKAIHLSRRERQIMDIIYQLGEVSAQQVLDKLPDPPSYSAVRAMLRKLEEKQHLAHKEMGAKYVYYPLVKHDEASQNALSRLVRTFFDGSATQAVNALLGMSMDEIPKSELDELEALIQKARQKEGAKSDGYTEQN